MASQRSWRGVLRALGERSGGSIKVVKRRADLLELETNHFSGHRRWSDQELSEAVKVSVSWEEVAERLGLVRDRRTGLRVKGHAVPAWHRRFTPGRSDTDPAFARRPIRRPTKVLAQTRRSPDRGLLVRGAGISGFPAV